MGIESYQLELNTNVDCDIAIQAVSALEKQFFGLTSIDSSNFQLVEEEHIVDIRVVRPSNGRAKISIRFALCQPVSIDPIFIKLVRVLERETAAVVNLLDDVEEGHNIEDGVILSSIGICRANWIACFGSKTEFLTCEDAILKAADGCFKELSIMLVENHKHFADAIVKEFLSDYRVEVIPSISLAKSVVEKSVFDYYLIDYDLDDGKGDEVVRLLKQIDKDSFVVAISSHEAGNQKLVKAGAQMVCSKMEFKKITNILQNNH